MATTIDFDNPSFFDGEYTYHFSKYSCSKTAFFFHILFSYLIFLSGLAAFISRLLPPAYKWIHQWLGRIYIISMIWATATSMLIHNSGVNFSRPTSNSSLSPNERLLTITEIKQKLPLAVLWSFLWVLLFLCIAWILILFHMKRMNQLAMKKVQEQIIANGTGSITDLNTMVNQAKGEIANSKTFYQRLFSLKAAHGVFMFTSWINIAGRIFASNIASDFACHTYPVYKSIDAPRYDLYASNQTTLTLLPTEDPDYMKTPWARTGIAGWAVALCIGPILGSFLIGACFSFAATRKQQSNSNISKEVTETNDHAN